MKKVVWWIILLACAFVSFTGYTNAQPDPAVQQQAQSAACAGKDDCKLSENPLYMYQYGITSKSYGFNTTQGQIQVQCTREYMFVGNWSCKPMAGVGAPPPQS